MEKTAIREKLLEMRRSLTSKFIEEASENVVSLVIQTKEVLNAKHVLIYSHFDNEIKTAKLTGWLLYQGKNVYLPVVDKKQMYAANIKRATLELNSFGIAQPKMDEADIVLPEKLDMVIVPGVAFDKEKNRVGYGGGYYDAFLKQTKAYRMAFAYDFQIVDRIPATEYDEKMDAIATPDFVLK